MHVNHSGPAKITVVAQSGAGVVICPRTEANLGDGLGDLPRRLVAQAPIAIGSDSPVDRCWREELRGLDYGQRLAQHRRNLRAAPSCDPPATAQRLFSRALQAGSAACGEAVWGLLVGARADALVVDPGNPDNPTTLGIPPERWLDAQLFSSPARPWQAMMVAGRRVDHDHHHRQQGIIAGRLEAAMALLWLSLKGMAASMGPGVTSGEACARRWSVPGTDACNEAVGRHRLVHATSKREGGG